MLPITDQEFQTARPQLNDSDDPKLPHTVTCNGQVRKDYVDEHARYQTQNSFIKFPSLPQIFGIRKRDKHHVMPRIALGYQELLNLYEAIVGAGTFGQVRRVVDELGKPAVVKIERLDRNPDVEKLLATKRFRESDVLQDLELSSGSVSRVNKKNIKKMYTHMNDLGVPLEQVLHYGQDGLNDNLRMTMAIDACLALADLHYFANKSKTRTRYAHLDLKLKNMTIDRDGRIHIVDFGASKKRPQGWLRKSYGTHQYRPPGDSELKKWQYDVFALKRILFFPQKFVHHGGYTSVSDHASRCESILTPEIIRDYNLESFIDTSHFNISDQELSEKNTITSLLLGAVLITRHLGLQVSLQALKNNSYLCLVLIDLYNAKHPVESMKHIVEEIMQKELSGSPLSEDVINKALLINRMLNLDVNVEDIKQSLDLAKLINKLERLGLVQHLHKIRAYSRLHDLLSSDYEDPAFCEQLNLFLEEIPAESEHFTRNIDVFIDHRDLARIMIRYQLIRSLHATVLNEAQVQILHECEKLRLNAHFFHRSILCILQNPKAMNAFSAVVNSQCILARQWIVKIGYAGKQSKEKSEIYIRAASVLGEKGCGKEQFSSVLSILLEAHRNLDSLKALVILLESNMLIDPYIKRVSNDQAFAKFIVSLFDKGLGQYLGARLNLPVSTILILAEILQIESNSFFEKVLNDRAIIEKLQFDYPYCVEHAKVFLFLIREQFEWNYLGSDQINSILALVPTFNSDDQEHRDKINEIIKMKNNQGYSGSQSNTSTRYTFTIFKPSVNPASSAMAEASSSSSAGLS